MCECVCGCVRERERERRLGGGQQCMCEREKERGPIPIPLNLVFVSVLLLLLKKFGIRILFCLAPPPPPKKKKKFWVKNFSSDVIEALYGAVWSDFWVDFLIDFCHYLSLFPHTVLYMVIGHIFSAIRTPFDVYSNSGGYFLACKDLGRMFDHTNSTLYARISPQWISELRQLWLNAP